MQLERILQSLEPVKIPSPSTEQYPTPAAIAAEVIQFALGRSDIAGRSVVDLGCGNGILAIAAKLSGAARVLGVDADPESIEVSRRNAEHSEVEVEWEVADFIEKKCAAVGQFKTADFLIHCAGERALFMAE